MKIRNIVLTCVAAVVCSFIAGWFYLTRPTELPSDCPSAVDWQKIRALAATPPGDKPSEVRMEHVVTLSYPQALTLPRAGWQTVPMHVVAYQLIFPDHTVIVDTAFPPSLDAPMITFYDSDAWQRVGAAMQAARAIYVTHEHFDHIGGLFEHEHTYWTHAHLTPEQISPQRVAPAAIPEAARQGLAPLIYEDPIAVAPGVVLIKAPGHTPGSQWVFLQLQNGTELLLLGDTAWFMANVETEQGPPPLSTMLMRSDRHATACQLASLKWLMQHEPRVWQIPGHDAERFAELLQAKVLQPSFKI